MASAGDDDLVASKTDGFKVGEKKTVEEYAKLGVYSVKLLLSTRIRRSTRKDNLRYT